MTRFGGKKWVKRKGIVFVEIDGQAGRAEVHLVRMPRHRQSQNESDAMAMKHYALCLSNDFGPDFSGDDVLPGLVYETLGEERGALRIVDESGDDFLYLASNFRVLSDADSQLLERSMAAQAA